MHRRLAAIAGTLAFSLLVPLSFVSADTVLEPSGSYVYVASEPVCDSGTYLCTTAQLSYGRTASGDFACLLLTYTNSELGGEIYDSGSACGNPETVFGEFTFTNGFLTGIGDTTLNITTDLGGNFDATFSGSFTPSRKAISSTNKYDVFDYPVDGCTTTYTGKQRLVTLTGTLTINGVAFTVSGDSRNVEAKLSKPRC